MQVDFGHPPIARLGHIQGIGVAAVDGIDAAEILGTLAGLAELAHHRAVQLQLVDLPAVIQVVLNSSPGTQQTTITMAGKTVIKAASTSGGPNAYLYERGDIVFGVETADEALATEAMSKLP